MNNVSIVTVCRNSKDTIEETIKSVLEQDYPFIEYLVIDGGSTDGTLEILDRYKDMIDKVISEPDRGIYDAMNKGIGFATGDLVCMLNSDDVYASASSVRHLVQWLQSQKVDSVYADLVITDSLDTNKILRYYNSSRFNPGRLRYGWMPPHPTFMVKRELYEKWGSYSLNYKISADYEMMVRLLYRYGVSYAYLPEVIVKMRSGGVSTRGLLSSWILNKEIVDACNTNGLNTSLLRLSLKIPCKLLEYLKKPKYSAFRQ